MLHPLRRLTTSARYYRELIKGYPIESEDGDLHIAFLQRRSHEFFPLKRGICDPDLDLTHVISTGERHMDNICGWGSTCLHQYYLKVYASVKRRVNANLILEACLTTCIDPAMIISLFCSLSMPFLKSSKLMILKKMQAHVRPGHHRQPLEFHLQLLARLVSTQWISSSTWAVQDPSSGRLGLSLSCAECSELPFSPSGLCLSGSVGSGELLGSPSGGCISGDELDEPFSPYPLSTSR